VSGSLIRQDLVPITAGYVLLMGTLAAGLLPQRRDRAGTDGRSAQPATGAPDRRAWLRLIRHMAATFVGGYLVLMAVVVAYYFGVARVSGNFLESAVTGCGLLLGLSAPLFLAASWLADRRDRRRAGRRPHPPASGPPPDHTSGPGQAGVKRP
jgi:hypothetical protein